MFVRRVFRVDPHRSQKTIRHLVPKLGGQPVFVEPCDWPICSQCGKEMEFIAQVPLKAPAKLSRRFNWAYLFFCDPAKLEDGEGICDSFDPHSGANLVLLQTGSKPVSVGEREARLPDFHLKLSSALELGPWSSRVLPGAVMDLLPIRWSKLGGAPDWIQQPDTPACPSCSGEMTFLVQIYSLIEGSMRIGDSDQYCIEPGGAHFYALLCEQECGPRGAAMLWLI